MRFDRYCLKARKFEAFGLTLPGITSETLRRPSPRLWTRDGRLRRRRERALQVRHRKKTLVRSARKPSRWKTYGQLVPRNVHDEVQVFKTLAAACAKTFGESQERSYRRLVHECQPRAAHHPDPYDLRVSDLGGFFAFTVRTLS